MNLRVRVTLLNVSRETLFALFSLLLRNKKKKLQAEGSSFSRKGKSRKDRVERSLIEKVKQNECVRAKAKKKQREPV